MGVSEVAADVRTRRRSLGLTQEQVAVLAGTSRQTVNTIERAGTGVAVGIVDAVCHALGLELRASARGADE